MTTYTNQQNYRQTRQREPTLGELFSNLSTGASVLVRKEVELAKAELSQKASKAGREVAVLAVAAALGNAALMCLIAALVLGLGYLVPLWAAALLVGVGLAIVAGVMAWASIEALKRINPVPEQTVETLQEDKEWLTAQMN
ncbi:MAG: phage holin family protein [Anaerolineaceae bacterium]|nr:phage holin family protein [Anaerolineaceae bacterium]